MTGRVPTGALPSGAIPSDQGRRRWGSAWTGRTKVREGTSRRRDTPKPWRRSGAACAAGAWLLHVGSRRTELFVKSQDLTSFCCPPPLGCPAGLSVPLERSNHAPPLKVSNMFFNKRQHAVAHLTPDLTSRTKYHRARRQKAEPPMIQITTSIYLAPQGSELFDYLPNFLNRRILPHTIYLLIKKRPWSRLPWVVKILPKRCSSPKIS